MKLCKLNIVLLFIMSIPVISLFACGERTFKDNFQDGINPGWSPKTQVKWELAREDEKGFYRLKEPGQHNEGIIRPAEYSLVKNLVFTDFTLKCKIRCDAPLDVRYRDAVIIFGYQDDAHFYYVQFSNISDDLHNTIMMVVGDYRKRINTNIPERTLTDLSFHDVKVKRKKEKIEVYFDGKLIMGSEDKTFPAGKVGIGSFDDVGSFDDFYVKGKVVRVVP